MSYVLIHGLGQKATSWNAMKDYLPNPEAFISLDLVTLLAGKAFTYENLYRSFANDCQAREEPLDLCGLSLGAVLALHYAIEHPDKVNSLVLIAAQYKMPRKLLGLQNAVFRVLPKGTFAKMGMSKQDVISLTTSMMALDFEGQLQSIKCPSLIICGSRDKANVKATMALGSTIPNARVAIMERAGHEVNVEAPHVLATSLERFYQEK